MLNWSDIDTVLLDMDGTLLDLSYDNYFWLHYLPEQYAKRKGLDLPATRIMLEQLSNSLKGDLLWYCVDHWSKVLDIDVEALKIEVQHLIQYRPYTTEFLTYLRNLNKTVILVTNAHPKSLQLKASKVDLGQYFDQMISSHEFSLAKENAGFWTAFANRENINLHRSLFIDDSLTVLQQAANEGVGHLLQILQPDSQQAPSKPSAFMGINHFNQLMPNSNK